MDIQIRPATDKDLPVVVEIFNQAIQTRMSTGYLAEVPVDDRQDWFTHHSTQYPLLVAEHEHKIVGYVSLEPYRPGRAAFRRTTEASLFIHEDFRRRGIGSLLLTAALIAARKAGFTSILAIILDKNTGSIRLLEKHGFARWGFLPKVGEIDGIVVNHVYYGRHLSP